MLNLTINATGAEDLYQQIRDLAGPAVLAGYPDEALLAEVRQRMAKRGLLLIVKPADEGEGAQVDNAGDGDPVPPAPKGKPGRKPKAEAAPAAVATTEPPKPLDAATDTAKAMTMTEKPADAPAPTVDDVKKALDAFAAVKGQMPAREKIKSVGLSDRLMDVKPEKFGALIEALKLAA
jgi:hypothetical protein